MPHCAIAADGTSVSCAPDLRETGEETVYLLIATSSTPTRIRLSPAQAIALGTALIEDGKAACSGIPGKGR